MQSDVVFNLVEVVVLWEDISSKRLNFFYKAEQLQQTGLKNKVKLSCGKSAGMHI